jgi:hypothetical protein
MDIADSHMQRFVSAIRATSVFAEYLHITLSGTSPGKSSEAVSDVTITGGHQQPRAVPKGPRSTRSTHPGDIARALLTLTSLGNFIFQLPVLTKGHGVVTG